MEMRVDICASWGLDTAAAVGAIVADEIDILVDSAGITFNHRLDVFACSAAPIQVTWIGYPITPPASRQYTIA